jgi:nucleoside-diphosphate-sugar epimerase
MKRVFLTGAGGFVGAHLLRRLVRKSYEVYAIMRPQTLPWRVSDLKNAFTVCQGDLTNALWVEQTVSRVHPDFIIHLAQYGGYPFQKDIQKIIQTNVIATINLVAAAEKISLEHFIHTGSSSEYGAKRAPMQEDMLLEPNSAYGVTKAAATLYLAHRGRDAKFPVTILRLFSVYGPYEEPGRLMPTVLLRALQGKELEFASPTIARDFTYIDDVVDAYMNVLEKKPGKGIILNVCTGKQHTLQDVAEAIRTNIGHPVTLKWGMPAKQRSFDTDVWVGDEKRAKHLLGWQARWGLEDGIREMLAWLKNHQSFYETVRT